MSCYYFEIIQQPSETFSQGIIDNFQKIYRKDLPKNIEFNSVGMFAHISTMMLDNDYFLLIHHYWIDYEMLKEISYALPKSYEKIKKVIQEYEYEFGEM